MVIGLEVHTELLTASKMFCGCANAFGAEPNTQVCPVCLGLPGSLPVLNARAVELAVAIGIALHCRVGSSTFHRKNYFYPDMPKDFQISQYDRPINEGGHLDLSDGSRVGIVRAHLEEDTGKSTHLGGTGRVHDADRSLVDYNRAGVPLVEIVSEPDIRSPEQARLYAAELRAVLIATGASDGRMEEGSMRVDANVSVRRIGAPLGTRCEIKNLNSLRSLQRAVAYEAERQVDVILAGGKVRQETRHWDEGSGETSTMRVKEEAEDYRYFREPDLTDLVPDLAMIERVRDGLGPMPADRRAALAGLARGADVPGDVLDAVVGAGLDAFVAAAVARDVEAGLALSRAANELAGPDGPGQVLPDAFAEVLAREAAGTLSATQAKAVLAELVRGGGDVAEIVERRGFAPMSAGDLSGTVSQAVAEHPDEWARYREGEDKLAQFFVGVVMKATRGRANGQQVLAELESRR